MLDEPTTLSSVARLIGETLEQDYGVESTPLFRRLGIDPRAFYSPGSRVTFPTMSKLWQMATEAAADPWLGFAVGERALPGDFYVLGQAWLASATLEGALGRLCRFRKVLTTLHSELELLDEGDSIALVERYRDHTLQPHKAAKDAGLVAFMKLCDLVTRSSVRPIEVELTISNADRSERYDVLFQCPIRYGCDREVWRFAASDLKKPLTGSIPEAAQANDRIAESYIASLDSNKTSTAVRQVLVQTLPGGRSDQDTVAKRLYRSRSTLQRQLSAEGTNYREILESTRRQLAEHYLRDGDHTLAQIAFMVGFADQSNFARAFKRWTGFSPGQYRKAA
jgi:AraC-like DNA-binding protein